MRKATATQYFIRRVNGDISNIINARQEISRGSGDYGVHWKFFEVSKEEFLEELKKDDSIYCIKTLSNKYVEVDKNDIHKYILG